MEIEHVKEKIMEGRPGFPRSYGPQRVDHQPGIPLFPQEATRDLVTIFLLTAIMFFLSSIREVVARRWVTPNGAALIPDGTMKWFFIIPPALVGLTTYIALRRLAFMPMRRWLLPYVAGLTLLMAVQIAWIFVTPGG